MCEQVWAFGSHTPSPGFLALLREQKGSSGKNRNGRCSINLPPPQLGGGLPPAPTALSRLSEPGDAPLRTPTDARPARHRSPQVPTPPGAPHPLSPHCPQKHLRAHTASHTCSPGQPLGGGGPAPMHLVSVLWGLGRSCRRPSPAATRLPSTSASRTPFLSSPQVPPGPGHFPGLPGPHAHSPAQPSPRWHPRGKKRKSR